MLNSDHVDDDDDMQSFIQGAMPKDLFLYGEKYFSSSKTSKKFAAEQSDSELS